MYSTQIECNIGVQDDFGGNVLVCAFTADYGNVELDDTHTVDIINKMLNDRADILDIPFDETSEPVFVQGYITKAFTNIQTSTPAQSILPLTDYSVYVLAIDTNDNRSVLRYGNRGSINAQSAPVINITITNKLFDTGINISGNVQSTVGYSTKFFTSTMNVVETNLDSLEVDVFNNTDFDKFVQSFDVNTDTLVQFSNVFTQSLHQHDNNSNYDPFVDTTKTHYLYSYAKNEDPHNTLNITKTEIQPSSSPLPDITVDFTDFVKRDTSSILNYNIGNVQDTELLVGVFTSNLSGSSLDDNGPLKEHLATYGGISSDPNSFDVSTAFVDTSSRSSTSMTPNQTYYTYALLRNTRTGQYSNIASIEILTGDAPNVLRATAQYVTLSDGGNVININANIEEETGGNVYAFVSTSTLDESTLSADSGTSLADTLTVPHTEINGNVTFADNIDSIVEDVPYFVYLLLTDDFNNKRVVKLEETVFKSSTLTHVVPAEWIDVSHALDFDVPNSSLVDPTDTTVKTANIENHINTSYDESVSPPISAVNTTITFSLYNPHYFRLTGITLDLSNIECTQIDYITVNPNPHTGQLIHNSFADGIFLPGKIHKININNNEYHTRVGIKLYKLGVGLEIDPFIRIVGIQLEGTVRDNIAPVIHTVELSGTQVTANVDDYSNVDLSVFLSPYQYSIPEEYANIHDQSNIENTDFSLGGKEVVLNASRDVFESPENKQSYDSSLAYYTYVRAVDRPVVGTSSTVYERKNPDGVSDVTDPPVVTLNIPEANTVYSLEANATAIKFDYTIEQPRIDVCPYRYAEFVRLSTSTHINLQDLNYSFYEFANLDKSNVLYDKTSTNVPIMENKSYDVFVYAKNSVGNVTFATETIHVPGERPNLVITNSRFNANGNIEVEFNFNDDFSDANISMAIFESDLNEDQANIKFETLTSASIFRANEVHEGTFVVEFGEYCNVSNIFVPLTDTERRYYITSYAQETVNENQKTRFTKLPIGIANRTVFSGNEVVRNGRTATLIDSPTSIGDSNIDTSIEFSLYLSIFFEDQVSTGNILDGIPLRVENNILYFDGNEVGEILPGEWNSIAIDRDVNDIITISLNGNSYQSELPSTLSDITTIGDNGLNIAVTDIIYSETSQSVGSLLDQNDDIAPILSNAVYDGANISFDVLDNYTSDIHVALYDTFYGTTEPYLADVKSHLETYGSFVRTDTADGVIVNDCNTFANVHNDLIGQNTVKHAYAFAKDTSTNENQRVIYLGRFNTGGTSDFDTVDFTFTVTERDFKANIDITSVTNVDTFKVTAYPSSENVNNIFLAYERIKAQLEAYESPTVDTSIVRTTYFANVDAIASIPMEYAESYDIFVLGINNTTGQTVVKGPLAVFTAVAPNITDVTVTNVAGPNIRLTCNIVEESSCNVYAMVFDSSVTLSVSEFKSSIVDAYELAMEANVKYVANVSGEVSFDFEKAHNEWLFDTAFITSGTSYNVYIYVENINLSTFNTAFERITHTTDGTFDITTPAITEFSVTPKDQSFDITANVNVNKEYILKATLFNNNPSLESDVAEFMKYAIVEYNETHDSSNVSIDTNLNQVVVNPPTPSNELIFNHDGLSYTVEGYYGRNPTIYILKNRIYNITTPVHHPLQFNNNPDNIAVIEYDTTNDTVRIMGIETGTIQYKCTTHNSMYGNIEIIDTPETVTVNLSDKTTEYYPFVYIEYTNREANSNIESHDAVNTGQPPLLHRFAAIFNRVEVP